MFFLYNDRYFVFEFKKINMTYSDVFSCFYYFKNYYSSEDYKFDMIKNLWNDEIFMKYSTIFDHVKFNPQSSPFENFHLKNFWAFHKFLTIARILAACSLIKISIQKFTPFWT